MLIDEFRGGKLGKISLERPDDVFEEEEVIVKEETEKERMVRQGIHQYSVHCKCNSVITS